MDDWAFVSIPAAAVLAGPAALGGSALRVLIYLTWKSSGGGVAWPGTPAIAADLGVSEGTVRRALAELREKDWLEVQTLRRENGKGPSRNYTLHNPAHCQEEEQDE